MITSYYSLRHGIIVLRRESIFPFWRWKAVGICWLCGTVFFNRSNECEKERLLQVCDS